MTYVIIGYPTCVLHMRSCKKYWSGLCKEVRVLTAGVLIRSDRGLRHYMWFTKHSYQELAWFGVHKRFVRLCVPFNFWLHT